MDIEYISKPSYEFSTKQFSIYLLVVKEILYEAKMGIIQNIFKKFS